MPEMSKLRIRENKNKDAIKPIQAKRITVMAEPKELEDKWFRIMKKTPNHWSKLDDIEDEIAKITGEDTKEVNKRLMAIHKQSKTKSLPEGAIVRAGTRLGGHGENFRKLEYEVDERIAILQEARPDMNWVHARNKAKKELTDRRIEALAKKQGNIK